MEALYLTSHPCTILPAEERKLGSFVIFLQGTIYTIYELFYVLGEKFWRNTHAAEFTGEAASGEPWMAAKNQSVMTLVLLSTWGIKSFNQHLKF